MSKAIIVKNLTQYNQSFDDKTLVPGAQVTVTAYTDDLLQGYALGHLLVEPPPTDRNIQWVNVNPCQLPLPVRLHGGFQGLYTPVEVTNLDPLTVGETVTKLVGRDDSRTNFRFRNVGSYPIGIGGANLTFALAPIMLEPGETLSESLAPNVSWYGVCDVGTSTSLLGLVVRA